MHAVFDGQDYLIILENIEELERLREGRLVSNLKKAWTGEDLGKKVTLKLGEHKEGDGIDFRYWPKYQGWSKVRVVSVKVNERAYNYVRERGMFGTRYSGLGDKIEILVGLIPGIVGENPKVRE